MVVIASEAAAAPLTILLFGPMQVRVHDLPLPHLRSRKALWLLALLTLRHERHVDREWLAGTLWPDVEPSRAFTNLRANLTDLRHALGDQSERLQSPNRHTLTLNLKDADVDLRAFDAAMLKKKPEAFQQAVALYRGPLLEDCAEEWIGQERNAREQDCLRALQTLGDTALAGGDYDTAIRYYQRAVGLDPWREAARRGWMEALAKSGDRNAALHVYREFIETLRSDPKATPDEETSALYQRLRMEARRSAKPQPAANAAVSAASEVSTARETATVSGYLPHPLTNLIGREEERIEVSAKLRGSRLVTLTGTGGIGKTRLALEVASESVQDGAAYTDGVWLVALESLQEGRLVVPQVASVLGVREEAEHSLLESVTNHLRAKRLLLVLDNCEHLLEASAQISAHLLRECARVRILATSREALGITGEAVWQTPSLPTPDTARLPQSPAALIGELMQYGSVQLFVERAESAQKGFALMGSNALAVAQVCSQLEGLPLAIELAAARVKAMAVQQLAARLNDRLSLLTGGNRTAQSRQQTLRATLDWSYALLSEAERLLLRRLSVFAGGWTLEAAEQVCLGESLVTEQILPLLASLVDKSLVRFEREEEIFGGRYRLLETVRQYAAEELQASGETESVKARHRNWCLALAEQGEAELQGVRQGLWGKRLEMEYGNLRAALDWSETYALDAKAGLRLAGALWPFWSLRGEYREGRRYLQQALAREDVQKAMLARGKALDGAANLAYTQGDVAAARTLYEESLSVFKELGDKIGCAESLNRLGDMAQNRGDYTVARALLEESLSVFKELGNLRGIAHVLGSLGNVARQQGDYAASRDLLVESLGIFRELGDLRNVARTLNNLGNVVRLYGDSDWAKTLYVESLHIRRELGDKFGSAAALSGLGALAFLQGDSAASRALHEESLRLRRELGNKQGVAWSVNNLGLVLQGEGDFAAAQTLHQEGLNLFSELDDKMGVAWSLNHLGLVAQNQGELASARSLFAQSLRLFANLGDTEGVAASLKELAGTLAAQGQAQQAVRLWGAAQSLRERIGAPLPLNEQAGYTIQLEQAREILREDAFAASWDEGGALSWEQAVAIVLKDEAKGS